MSFSLSYSVAVACKTNRRLSHKQDQHASALCEKVRQVEELETALIKARVQISEQPLQAVDRQRAETKVTLLQARLLQVRHWGKRVNLVPQ